MPAAPAHTVRDRRRVTTQGTPTGYQASGGGILVPLNFAFSRTYDAANYSRNRGWRQTIAADSKQTITPAVRTTLMSHGRYLSEVDGFVGGAIDETARYTIADGIYPLPLTGDTGLDRQLRNDFLEWANVADLRGVFHLFELAVMQSSTMDTDGDNFTVKTSTDPGNPAGYPKIQLLRGHRVGGTGAKDEDANFFDGVFNAPSTGAPQRYRVLDPEDPSQFQDLPASGVIHCFEGIHPEQIRGLSAIRRGMEGMFDARESMGFMHTKIKQDAARATVIRNSTGQVEDEVYDEDVNQGAAVTDLTYEQLCGGEIIRLGPGEEIQSVSGDNPGALFMPWMEFSKRNFATGYHLPLEFLWKCDVGSAAQRFLLRKAQRRFAARRNLLVIPKWFRQIYFYWLTRMMVRKAYKRVPNWYRVAWQVTSADLSIDAGRDSAAALNELRYGSRSLHEDAAERGRDWNDVRAEIDLEAADLVVRAKKMAAAQDITMELAIALLQMRTPNGNPAAATAAPANE